MVLILKRGEPVEEQKPEVSAKSPIVEQKIEKNFTKSAQPQVQSEQVVVYQNGKVVDGEMSELMKQTTENFRDSMLTKNKKKVERLIAKLVKDLNLTPEQEKELERYFAEQMELANGSFTGNFDPENARASMNALAALEGKGLDGLMEDLLTPEQEELWVEREEKRAHREADSAALKGLSNIGSVLEIDEEQRDALYDLFYKKKQVKEEANTAGNGLGAILGNLTSGMGENMDADSLLGPDFGEAVVAAHQDGGGAVDMADLLSKQRERQIDREMGELESILNEEQLGDYREHLEAQESPLDGMIGVGGSSSIRLITE